MEFMISLLLVLLAAWLGGVIAHRIGYPSMLGELLAGMILGPALLGWLPNHEGLKFIAEFGIFIMMLYIGAEIDPRELLKASRNAILAAIGGFVVPFGAGFAVTYWYLQRGGVEERSAVLGGLFVGMAGSKITHSVGLEAPGHANCRGPDGRCPVCGHRSARRIRRHHWLCG